MARCMSDNKMLNEYKDASQRYAVCINTYKEEKK